MIRLAVWAMRYGPWLVVAAWFGFDRTSWLRMAILAVAMAAFLAFRAKRRTAEMNVSLPLAFLFEAPTAIATVALGWLLGAVVHHLIR